MYEITQALVKVHFNEAMQVFGLEGTVEKIENLYKNHPKIKELFLEEYKRIVNHEEK